MNKLVLIGRREGWASNRDRDTFEGIVGIDFANNGILERFVGWMGAHSLSRHISMLEKVHHLGKFESRGLG
jgi:hypothetical protein